MSDLISRQAAIDALSTPHGILYPIRTVEELPSAQPEQRWIPVTERVPEDSNFYIVTHKDFLVGFRWYSVFHGWEWQEKDEPVAWMPLPEPYREEGGRA